MLITKVSRASEIHLFYLFLLVVEKQEWQKIKKI